MTKFTLEYTEGIAEDLADLRAYERSQILNKVEDQLTYSPTQATHHKKMLFGLVPPWEYVEPIWELRIGEYRVFYDVDEATATVIIRAIRHKPPHKTTQDIL